MPPDTIYTWPEPREKNKSFRFDIVFLEMRKLKLQMYFSDFEDVKIEIPLNTRVSFGNMGGILLTKREGIDLNPKTYTRTWRSALTPSLHLNLMKFIENGSHFLKSSALPWKVRLSNSSWGQASVVPLLEDVTESCCSSLKGREKLQYWQ